MRQKCALLAYILAGPEEYLDPVGLDQFQFLPGQQVENGRPAGAIKACALCVPCVV